MPQALESEAPVARDVVAITYEQFLQRADEHAEWVGGKVVPMAPVSDEHADVVGFLSSLIRFWVDAKGAGIVRTEPFQMKTGPELPGRSPDILFLANAHLDRRQAQYVQGPADLVIEVISPESRARDRGEKFFEYEQGGVREYWLIDPVRKQAEFYQRGEDGIYRVMPIQADGLFRSMVLKDLWLDVGWLWQRPLPSLVDVLRRWRLV